MFITFTVLSNLLFELLLKIVKNAITSYLIVKQLMAFVNRALSVIHSFASILNFDAFSIH
jgi:hypothetical protein